MAPPFLFAKKGKYFFYDKTIPVSFGSTFSFRKEEAPVSWCNQTIPTTLATPFYDKIIPVSFGSTFSFRKEKVDDSAF